MTYRTAAIHRSATASRRADKTNRVYWGSQNSKKLGPVSNFVVVLVMLGGIGMLYLTQITKTTQYSYELNDLQTVRNEELKRNQALKEDAARLKSIERVANSNVAKQLKTSTTNDTEHLN